ncbi:Tex-like N-terminal domain-containing protein, partial [Streptomyces sp. NPDC057540]|uniref:Tex-like N-terminal domain-containing protein n=1 Tax=Streptomyces sp. NPDC057540 TaxID=3346160 RepID=UPI0036C9F5F6
MTTSIEARIAEELGVRERQVRAAVELLDGGSTVPFIARYRKEATEMLDDAPQRPPVGRLGDQRARVVRPAGVHPTGRA